MTIVWSRSTAPTRRQRAAASRWIVATKPLTCQRCPPPTARGQCDPQGLAAEGDRLIHVATEIQPWTAPRSPKTCARRGRAAPNAQGGIRYPRRAIAGGRVIDRRLDDARDPADNVRRLASSPIEHFRRSEGRARPIVRGDDARLQTANGVLEGPLHGSLVGGTL